MVLPTALHRRAVATPTKVAYTFTSATSSDVDMTFATLDASARRIALMLTSEPKGFDRPVFTRGDCVLLWYPPDGSTHELVAAFWGCLYAGAVAVIVDDAQSLHRLLQDTHAVLGLTTSALLRQRKLDKVKDALNLPKFFNRRKHDQLRQGFSQSSFDDDTDVSRAAKRVTWFTPAISPATPSKQPAAGSNHQSSQARDATPHSERAPPASLDASTVACVVYTAGSSAIHGKPVQLTHANLAAAASPFNWLEPSDCMVGTLPLHAPGALVQTVVLPVVHGCRSVLVSAREMETDATKWMDIVASERAVVAFASPSAITAAAACRHARQVGAISRAGSSVGATRPSDLSSLVRVVCTGGPLHPTALEAFVDTFKLRPSQVATGYSVGEATFVATTTAPPRTRESAPPPHVLAVSRRVLEQCHQLELLDTDARPVDVDAVLRNDALPDEYDCDSKDVMYLTSSGWPAPDTSVVVVDPVSCVLLPDGLVGEIWVRGPSVSPGYLNHPSSHHHHKFADGTLRLASHRRSRNSNSSTRQSVGLRPSVAATASPTAPDSADGPTFLRTGDLGVLHRGELYVIGRAVDVLQLPDRWLTPYVVEASVRRCSVLVSRVCVFGDGGVAIVVVETTADLQSARDGPAIAHSLCNSVIKCVVADHELHVGKVVVVKRKAMPVTACGKVQRGRAKTLVASQDPSAVVLEYMHYPVKEVPVSGTSEGFLI